MRYFLYTPRKFWIRAYFKESNMNLVCGVDNIQYIVLYSDRKMADLALCSCLATRCSPKLVCWHWSPVYRVELWGSDWLTRALPHQLNNPLELNGLLGVVEAGGGGAQPRTGVCLCGLHLVPGPFLSLCFLAAARKGQLPLPHSSVIMFCLVSDLKPWSQPAVGRNL